MITAFDYGTKCTHLTIKVVTHFATSKSLIYN